VLHQDGVLHYSSLEKTVILGDSVSVLWDKLSSLGKLKSSSIIFKGLGLGLKLNISSQYKCPDEIQE
jgi:hypothetical protein